eukprot:PITA_32558
MVHTTQNPVVVPTDATQLAEYNKKNNKGKRLILDGVKYHCIPHVREKRNAHEMWTTLSNLYQSTNENRNMVLKEKLKTIKMGNDSATGYLTKITNVRDELAAIGEVIPPIELVQIAVNDLHRSWMNFGDGVCARETLPTRERFWDDCIQTEIRKGQLGAAKLVEHDEDVALSAGGKKGKGKKQTSTRNGGGKGKGKGKQGVREYFLEISESGIDMEVVLGDDRVVRVVGVGTMTFQRESKPPLKVSNVLYVLGMRKNLISVSALEDRGYEVYKFAFRSLLELSSSTDSRASSSELCEIWHCRMGHMYHGALNTLREITTGVLDFSTDHFDTCRGCAMGKFSKSPFPSSDNRATVILDLIHSNVSGQMSHVSLSGYEYYVLFIDDHSRRTWIYFLKTKSEVFKLFKEFRALVETQTGRKIKSLRSDNGGEYTLGDFVDYCAEAGIRREFTVPYNPQ